MIEESYRGIIPLSPCGAIPCFSMSPSSIDPPLPRSAGGGMVSFGLHHEPSWGTPHFSIGPGCARVKTYLLPPEVRDCWCPLSPNLSMVYVPCKLPPLFCCIKRVGVQLIHVGSSCKFLIVSQVTALCGYLHSSAKTMNGLIPLARVD